MSDVRLESVRKSFGAVEVIKGVDLAIGSGEFAVFVGPSGCGKSTLLRMICGLESVTGRHRSASRAATSPVCRRASARWRWSSSPTPSIRT